MTFFKKALFGLLLAGSALTSAFAAPIYDYQDTVFVPADASHPGTLQTWLFGAGGPGVLSGQTFSFEFLFNTPPSSPTTWFGFEVGSATVDFDDGGFYALGLPPSTVPGFAFSLTGSQARGHGFLDSGLYDLFLTGTFLVDGASFLGTAVDDVAPVPEPMTLGLMGVGLAGLIGARRRRAVA
jgi:hypothetical protein